MAAAVMIRHDGCMTGFVGADPAQLRALSKQMARSADRIGASLRSLGSALEAPGQWLGPDMQSFRQSWHGELMPQSKSVIMSLLEASRALQSNADEQEKASQGSGGRAGQRRAGRRQYTRQHGPPRRRTRFGGFARWTRRTGD
jgi:uncharacterized protein YukE